MDPEAATRVLTKLRSLVADLDDDERAMLAALLAPGVARAHEQDDEVVGFGVTGWSPARLPEALSDALRREGSPAPPRGDADATA